MFPKSFHYLRSAIEACGDTRIVPFDPILNRHVPFIERITPEQLDCLKHVHAEILRRNDDLSIATWCESMRNGSEEERKAAWRIGGILSVLYQLADREISPFCDTPLKEPEPQPLDETPGLKLPQELEYLIGPALHFGERYPSEMQMIRFFEEASPEECDQLAALAERVRQNDDWPKVLQWFQDIGTRNVPYHDDIDRLFNLMDLCDFDFESG